MSSLHSFPAELISHIMVFLVEGPACFPIDIDEPRLQLTQICTTWRKIAFNTPLLWDLRFPASYSAKNPLKLANYWWSQRSGSQLLLLINPMPLQCPPPRSSRLFEKMVLPFAPRLGVIRINLDCAGLSRLLELPLDSFQNLRKISIWLQDTKYQYPWRTSTSSLEAAPHLHSVCFSFSAEAQLKPSLPWRQLTRLVLVTSTSGFDLLTMLSQCSCLEDGVFLEVGTLDPAIVTQIETFSNQPLHLPKLTKLSIRFACTSFFHVTSRLILPNLNELQFAVIPSRVDPCNDFITFLQPMKTSLHHLQLGSGLAGDSNVMNGSLFENLPCIRSLIIPPHYIILPSTLERISRSEILREVERLQFGVYKILPVIDMLRVRKVGSSHPIKEIRVRPRSLPLPEEVEDLCSQGVTVDLLD